MHPRGSKHPQHTHQRRSNRVVRQRNPNAFIDKAELLASQKMQIIAVWDAGWGLGDGGTHLTSSSVTTPGGAGAGAAEAAEEASL